jgi:hypothetical protein
MSDNKILTNDEKLDFICKYLNNNNEMLDIVYNKLYDKNGSEMVIKKNELIYECVLPFASYLYFNYDEEQLEMIKSSFEKSLR